MPSIAEKGYLDIRVVVNTPGGHSSIPPPHTSIGMLSRMLAEYEAQPHEAHLKRGTPMFDSTQCLAAHAPKMPRALQQAIRRAAKSDRALEHVEEILFEDAATKALAGTTQAIDLIRGGVKANALPESAYAIVNHRIDASSSVKSVMDHNTDLLRPFAEQFNLSFTAFGTTITGGGGAKYGTLDISDAWGTALEPAPITLVEGNPYKLLSATIKAVYAAHWRAQNVKDQEIVVAPGMMLGNTDTRFYWGLSDHIFRCNHRDRGKRQGVHTINENILVEELLEQIRFFSTLIMNVDAAEL
jgi:Gly-Xaa carboxypeptidase